MPTKAEDVVMPFGKHEDETLGQILEDDPCYFDWLRDIKITSPTLKAAVDEMLDKHADEIDRAVERRGD